MLNIRDLIELEKQRHQGTKKLKDYYDKMINLLAKAKQTTSVWSKVYDALRDSGISHQELDEYLEVYHDFISLAMFSTYADLFVERYLGPIHRAFGVDWVLDAHNNHGTIDLDFTTKIDGILVCFQCYSAQFHHGEE